MKFGVYDECLVTQKLFKSAQRETSTQTDRQIDRDSRDHGCSSVGKDQVYYPHYFHQSFCLSVFLFVCFSVSSYVYLPLCLSLYMSLFLCLPLCICMSFSVYLCLSLSFSVCS